MNIEPNDIVICLGEGKGVLLNYLLKEGVNAYGMDIWYGLRDVSTYYPEQSTILKIKQMLTFISKNKGRIFSGDATSLPLKTESVDVILSNKMLNNIGPADQFKVIQEVLRALKIGGIAKISGYMPLLVKNKDIEVMLSQLQESGKIKYEIVEKTVHVSKATGKSTDSYTIAIEKTDAISVTPSTTIKPLNLGPSLMNDADVISLISRYTGSYSQTLLGQLEALIKIWTLDNGFLSYEHKSLLFGSDNNKGIYNYIYTIVVSGGSSYAEELRFFLVLAGALSWQNHVSGSSNFGILSRDAVKLICTSYVGLGLSSQPSSMLEIDRNIESKTYIKSNTRFIDFFKTGIESINSYNRSAIKK